MGRSGLACLRVAKTVESKILDRGASSPKHPMVAPSRACLVHAESSFAWQQAMELSPATAWVLQNRCLEVFCVDPDAGQDPLSDYYNSGMGFIALSVFPSFALADEGQTTPQLGGEITFRYGHMQRFTTGFRPHPTCSTEIASATLTTYMPAPRTSRCDVNRQRCECGMRRRPE
jgi:hypothetical protein